MIRTLILTTAMLAATSAAALAADLPSRRAPPVYIPPPPLPVFTWTGFYVGAQVGYEFGRAQGFASAGTPGLGIGNGRDHGGVIGGAHVGYLVSTQSLGFGGAGLFGGGVVLGVEGDVDGSGYSAAYGLGGLGVYERRPIQGSVRGRLGVAVDRALFYATGGVAFGDLQNRYATSLGVLDTVGHTRVGYTVGGGVEYAFTNSWSVRAEYRYTDFGSYSDTLLRATGGGVNVHHRDTDNRVQAGISYKFNGFGPVPVVARY